MNYRLYTFVNFYLSSIQQGIQTAHVLGEIVRIHGSDNAVVDHWLHQDKTIVVLNGGNSAAIENIYKECIASCDYPGAYFIEDEESLNGAITACGVILPESVWGARRGPTTDGMGGYYYEYGNYLDPDRIQYNGGVMFNLIDALRKCDLAK